MPDFWLAFFFGIMPDFFSFGIFSISTWLGFEERISFRNGPPPMHDIPYYVDGLYNITHSFVIFAFVFGAVWLLRKKAPLIMLGWPLHILFDIFTHSTKFFPTPFLWPFSSYRFDGISWANPKILIPNVLALLIIYVAWYLYRRRVRRKKN